MAKNSPEVELLNESYTVPNRYLPLFAEKMVKHGLQYNKFAYGAQLFFLKNRIRRENLCKDSSKIYLIDRSIYEDRHIFAKLLVDHGVMSKEEYNEYKDMFEKIVRNMVPPSCFILLKCDPDLCYERMVKRNFPFDAWITRDILHSMEHLYRERLKDRVYLYNPDVHLIELEATKYNTIEELANEAASQLNQYFKGAFKEVSTEDGHKIASEVQD